MIYDRLTFKNKSLEFDIKLNGDIVLVEGDSAIGKTLAINVLRTAVNNGKIGSAEKPIVFLQYEDIYSIPDINRIQKSLIILDNFDEAVKNYPRVLEQMDTTRNQFLIIARSSYPTLHIPMKNCSFLHVENNRVGLVYYDSDFHRELSI